MVIAGIESLVAPAAGQIVQHITGIQDDYAFDRSERESSDDGKPKFPYWNKLQKEMATLRKEARARGERVSPAMVYNMAFAQVASDEKGRARLFSTPEPGGVGSQAHSVGGDAELSSSHGAAARRIGPVTTEQLERMSTEDRARFWDEHGDTPI
jgi:hypothetical protein